MEIFYAHKIDGSLALLDADESAHCIKVLRHRAGDAITVVDGCGSMFRCRLADDSHKGATAEILETVPDWGGHSYSLNMAVCPTKNNDRFEWFAFVPMLGRGRALGEQLSSSSGQKDVAYVKTNGRFGRRLGGSSLYAWTSLCLGGTVASGIFI